MCVFACVCVCVCIYIATYVCISQLPLKFYSLSYIITQLVRTYVHANNTIVNIIKTADQRCRQQNNYYILTHICFSVMQDNH